MLGNRSVRFGARREARPKLQAAFCARRSLAAGFANAIPRAWMSVRHFCKRLFVLSDRRRQLAQAGFYIQVRAAEIANGVPRGQGVPSIPAAVPTTLILPRNHCRCPGGFGLTSGSLAPIKAKIRILRIKINLALRQMELEVDAGHECT